MQFDLGIQPASSKISSLKYRLFFCFLAQIVDDWPKAVSATILSNVLKPGFNHYYLDSKVNTINPTGSPGESEGNIQLILSPQLEGISRATLEWVYKMNGERVIAFWENCLTGEKFIAGNPCSGGLLISVQSLGNQDDGKMGVLLNLTGGECPDPFYFYEGPFIREAAEPVAQDSTIFPLTAKSQYQLPENTAATSLNDITGVTDSDVGRVIELIGNGYSFPTTIDPSTRFILKNGVSWEAKLGNQIDFQIVKTGTGPTDYTFYEVYRS